jgi:hypothetical protein
MNASEWNRHHDPGTPVTYRPIGGVDANDMTAGRAFSTGTDSQSQWVCLVKVGLCCVECIRPLGEPFVSSAN